MPPIFDGISEKLKRASEHIKNLEIEIERFYEKSGYGVLPQDNMQLLFNTLQNLEKEVVPLRFSVLIGEVAHQLRSSLDHVVWEFSAPTYRLSKDSRFIEFPILESRPTKEGRFTRYERKIQGISNHRVLDLIERLQPYDPTNHPIGSLLLLLHQLDIWDKHRELVLCISSGGITFPPEVLKDVAMRYQQGVLTETEGQRELKNNRKIVPTISFRNVGQGKPQGVLPTLYELYNVIFEIVGQFKTLTPSVP